MTSLRSLISSVVDNDEGGFGPSSSHLPPQFKDIPYAPFSKNDKLGRIVDWNAEGAANAAAPQQKGKYSREPKEAYGASAAGTFAYYHDEDEASFSVVSGAAGAKKPAGQSGGGLARGGGRPGQMARGGQFGARGPNGQFLRQGGPNQFGARGPQGMRNQPNQGGRGGYQGGRGGFQGGRGGWRDKEQRTREASIDVGSDWTSLEEIEFSRLQKLRLDVDIDEVETMCVLLLRPPTVGPQPNDTLTPVEQLRARFPVRVRPDVRQGQHQERQAAADHRPRPLQPDHLGRPRHPGHRRQGPRPHLHHRQHSCRPHVRAA